MNILFFKSRKNKDNLHVIRVASLTDTLKYADFDNQFRALKPELAMKELEMDRFIVETQMPHYLGFTYKLNPPTLQCGNVHEHYLVISTPDGIESSLSVPGHLGEMEQSAILNFFMDYIKKSPPYHGIMTGYSNGRVCDPIPELLSKAGFWMEMMKKTTK